MRIQGEVEFPVPVLEDVDAVSLFSERAQTETSDEIAELCRRLDRLPLAIELAAAWATTLTPAQILVRLDQRLDLLRGGRDVDPRQQTLRATIEWSYDLLSDPGAAPLRTPLRVHGWLYLRGCRSGGRCRSADAARARGKEPRPILDRSLLDAGDHPRVRARTTRVVGNDA